MPGPCTRQTRDDGNGYYISFHFSTRLDRSTPLPSIDEDVSVKIGISIQSAFSHKDRNFPLNITDTGEWKFMVDGSRYAGETKATGKLLRPARSCLKDESSRKSNEQQKRRGVRFEMVAIRRYDVILGDHPGCTHGVPIALDWNYTQQPSILLDDYQEMKGMPRKVQQLYLSPTKRWMLLTEAGFSSKELKQQAKSSKRIRQERIISAWLCPGVSVRQKMKQAIRVKI